jgi:organic hydroperoxide reductase OsmC/OhrA
MDVMNWAHKFRVVAWWSSARTGIAKSDSAPNAIHFTAPIEFGGIEGRWTPEDLLLGAVASCFTTTFRTIAEHAQFEYVDFQVAASGIVITNDSGCDFTGIAIRADLTVDHEEKRELGLRLLHKAHGLCLVARTLAVQQSFNPVVTAGVPSLMG